MSIVKEVDTHSSYSEADVLLLNDSDLGMKVDFADRGNINTWRKTVGVALISANLSPRVDPSI